METGHAAADMSDVIVVGGGPAGAAVAIACAQRGLTVALFERAPAGRDSPGETLHPGVEPLLGQLGIDAAALAAVTGARHPGVWIEWGGARRFDAFGADAAGPWRGFQVERAGFDAMLLARARRLGVTVHHEMAVEAALEDDGAVCGVRAGGRDRPARLVIDASGRARCLGRALDIASVAGSPPLHARYGYVRGSCPGRDGAPLLQGDAAGWTWTAMVRPQVYQWTHVRLDGTRPDPAWLPPELDAMAPLGRARGADVTWRMSSEAAGPGWFMVGDAAALLDPSSSHGVLKALMSGIAAAHMAAAVLAGRAPADVSAQAYHAWLQGWFAHDARRLQDFYRELGATGFDQVRPAAVTS